MGQTLLLAGRPGIGKTTVIKNVVRAVGEDAGGFYTEEIRSPRGRQGFRLISLDGHQTTLAHVRLRDQGYPRVGRYGVDVAALDRIGVTALEQALVRRRIVIIDEIGKMELLSEAFRAAVMEAIAGAMPVVATIMARPHPWIDPLKARTNVTLWTVTVKNRDKMPSEVLDWLHQAA